METLQRLVLIVTLTGLVSNPWLGAIEQPAVANLPADAVPAAPITLVSAAPAAAPAAISATAPADEAVPQAPPARRGGGMGKALKK